MPGNGFAWEDAYVIIVLTLIAALQTRWIARFADNNADRLAAVPDSITLGIMGGARSKEIGEITLSLSGNTKDMRVILEARKKIAELIGRIQKILKPKSG